MPPGLILESYSKFKTFGCKKRTQNDIFQVFLMKIGKQHFSDHFRKVQCKASQ